MRYIFALLFALLAGPTLAADNMFPTPGNALAQGAVNMCVVSGVAVPCGNATTPFQVAGSFSATLSGFTPGGTFATLTAAGTSGSVALPAGTTIAFQNTGTTTVSCTLGVGSATATANQIQIPASSTVFVTPGSNTFGACIDQTGSASNLIVLAGGSGLGAGFGGGGGSGGGGAVTLASGAVASGAYSAGSFAAGALSAGSFAIGAGVDGWDTTQGAKADAAWVSGSGSVISLLKNIAGGVGAAIPPGANIIGKFTTDQTTHGTTDLVAADLTKIAGVATVADPCQTAVKVYTPINTAAIGNTIITAVAAKKKFICSIIIYPGGADNVAIYQATTASACVTAPTAIFGGVTTATGFIMTAQAGFAFGNGMNALAATTLVNTDICVTTSTTAQLSGGIVTVDQ